MDNSLSFFRVFDLAFFAPGMLLFGAMWYSGCFPIDPLSSHDDTVHGILTGAFAVVSIYVLGLICHGIQRLVLWFIRLILNLFILIKNRRSTTPNNTEPTPPPWFAKLTKDSPRIELSLYFWYMRSTCWNLVVAIVLAVIIRNYQNIPVLSLSVIAISVFVIVVLAFLGYEFDKSMRKAAS
jgi:FtsH-binding integral membrane protein